MTEVGNAVAMASVVKSIREWIIDITLLQFDDSDSLVTPLSDYV